MCTHQYTKSNNLCCLVMLFLFSSLTKYMRSRDHDFDLELLFLRNPYICRHEIFPEFSGIPEFSRPQRSFSWKSQIRFNIYGGGGTIYPVCSLSVSNAGTARHKSSQASGVYTMSTFTRIYCNSLIFCIVCVCTSLLILKTVVCHFKTISGYNSDHCLYVL